MVDSVTVTFDEASPQRQFRSFESFLAWLDKEEKTWAWLANYPTGNAHQNVTANFAAVRQGVLNIQAAGQPLSSIADHVSSYYQPTSWLRQSEGAFGKQIEDIRKRKGDSGAAFAYCFSKQSVSLAQASEPSHLAACILLAMPEFDRPESIASRLQAERKNYRQAIVQSMEKIDAAASERSSNYASHLHIARRLAIRQLLRSRRLDKAFRHHLADEAMSTTSSIRAVEDTFRRQMGLQAPVEYWNSKADTHRVNASAAVRRLQWFFPFAAAFFILAFWGAAKLLLSSNQVHQAVYLIVAAGLASLAALLFWVGRLLTKLYLSQHHLVHDAEERAVMTTTYLALSHENAATDDDKKIILAALFRPTVDGLIKDDGPSDVSMAALLSRLGMGR